MSDRRFIFNAFIYLEPVQRSEDGCDMRRFRSFNHSTCKTVLNLAISENGHISATGDPIHIMFSSRVRFSGSADRNGAISGYRYIKSKLAAGRHLG